ncbi:tyrosine-type recombinase/integrase [Shewanella glacialipiscicola]|uniref:Integrase n=1 Tax=Shewanella glacialipiscicola TaxID=614069 RepID=A0ABQ6J5S3_9GAMM|nr:site-specific integrase [Shewanella glacialipiscicola]MCL1084824.1 site-specific integrase [Shewanella glacialipiscicola]MCU7995500.1 site-specific integrase [Shewanella glacialipiscicola]MCU8026747.1 site-specific integrase [Shewanella glacialipiscicola]GIU12326.1 integrase [Shewanella glacialipiscicola]GMA82221.1 integrase [Shewanella glacialipiscicola]
MQLPPVIPLFDSFEFIQVGNSIVNQYITQISMEKVVDAGLVIEHASDWLFEQKHNENNYKTYRSELTTFLHWCFDVVSMSPIDVTRKDMSRYVDYCQTPPIALIGYFNVPQFRLDKLCDERVPNAQWRPFVGKKHLGQVQPYVLSDNALKTKMAILSSFYSYLTSEEYCERNPAQIWLNHSRFSANRSYQRQNHEDENNLAFTELQWSYVMSTVTAQAEEFPELHQRSLFLISLIYSCYLRISDVSARAGYSPVMNQFKHNQQTGIWSFHIPLSKGGKKRNVAISKALLEALVKYRQFLGLTDYPGPNENHPLFVRHKAAGRGRDVGILNANLGIRHVRDEIQSIINLAAERIETDGFTQDGAQMRKLTAHNIRHTGITHDININRRPLSHVQADAGHESIDTTSQYLHTSQVERHESAFNKPIDHLKGI